jgi:hypothetical protein
MCGRLSQLKVLYFQRHQFPEEKETEEHKYLFFTFREKEKKGERFDVKCYLGGVGGGGICATCVDKCLRYAKRLLLKGSVSRDFLGPFLACMDRSTVGLYKNL